MFAVVLEHVCFLVLGLSGLRTYGNSFHCLGNGYFFRLFVHFLGAFAKLRKATISFVTSVRPHGRTRLPLGGF